jgi:quercetin dioxygenase-like cupin family protein
MAFFKLGELEEREMVPGFRARFIHSDHMTLASWTVKAGSIMPEHSHPHEQITAILEGDFEMTVGGKTSRLSPNTVGTIPANVIHSGVALTDCRIMDVFYPVREDYR